MLLLAAACLLDRAFPPDLTRYRALSLALEARDGTVLDVLTSPDGYYRLPAGPGDVSSNYVKMLVACEDRRFWWNPGVDPVAMARAVAQLVTHGHVVSGGSTLTMQVARLLTPHRHDLAGKFLDMARAVQLTAHFSKPRILSMYLTLAPYGGNIEGVRAASLIYFRREPDALTDAQAALLVALPRSPERLRPDRHLAAALAAARRVLARTGENPDFGAADLPDLARHGVPALAPHLAERLRGEGFKGVVRTTLDARLQAEIDEIATDQADDSDPRESMAALVVDNRSRKILAYLGGRDYFGAFGMVDMVRAIRSPGSALKPFIYGMALDDSLLTPSTMLQDSAADFGGYAPRDFDGGFEGEVTAAEALQESRNLPALEIVRAVGPARFVAAVRAAGAVLALPGQSRPSLAVALGGMGMSLSDLTMLYAGLADGGEVAPISALAGAPAPAGAVMSQAAAAAIGEILRGSPLPDGVAPGTRQIAFKTGTSYGSRDAWSAGFSPGYTVVVWVGRVDGTACPGILGREAAAPVMFDIFGLLPADTRAPPPAPPFRAAGLQIFGAARPGLAASGLAASGLAASGLAAGPRILFPPDGAVLQVSGQDAPVALEAAGGAPPYRWLVNGEMLPAAPVGESMDWQPDGPGFAHIAVIDKNEATASEDVQMK